MPVWSLAIAIDRMSAGGATPVRLSVSGISSWQDATLSLGEPHVLLRPPLLERIVALTLGSQVARCYGDLAGCALVLKGQAEAWIEAGVQLWDLGPLPVLVEEAGGRFTDLDGNATIATGSCVASNGRVHDVVLRALAGRA